MRLSQWVLWTCSVAGLMISCRTQQKPDSSKPDLDSLSVSYMSGMMPMSYHVDMKKGSGLLIYNENLSKSYRLAFTVTDEEWVTIGQKIKKFKTWNITTYVSEGVYDRGGYELRLYGNGTEKVIDNEGESFVTDGFATEYDSTIQYLRTFISEKTGKDL